MMLPYLLKYYLEIGKWRKLDAREIRARQIARFNEIFQYAKQKSRFYRELYRKHGVYDLEIRTMQHVERLPIIYKSLLRQYSLSDITTCDTSDSRKFNIRSTSGSTGEPFKIAYSKVEDYTNQARHYWSLRQYGYQPWKNVLIVTRYEPGATYQYERDVKLLRFVQKLCPLFRRQIASIYEPVDSIVEKLRREAPYILWSTPSILQIIAYKLEEKGIRLDIPYVGVTSETMFEKQAALFRRIFGSNLVNYYGAMEAPTLGFDINMEHRFRLFPNSAMFEFTDPRIDDGRRLATLVLTNLINRTMPIIRYNTGDVTCVEDGPEFGIKYLGRVIGRLDDILEFPDGTYFAHHHAHEMFMDFHECQHFRFIQYPDGTVALQLKVGSDCDKESVRKSAMKRWQKRFPDKALRIEFVNEFPIDTTTGKTRNIEKLKTPAGDSQRKKS